MTTTTNVTNYAKYDYTILLDASGSMGTEMGNGKTRWENAKEFALGLAGVLEKYDSNGISVGTFGGTVKFQEDSGKEKVSQFLSELQPFGSTPLHKVLELALKPQAGGKPEVIFVITDGEPDDRVAVKKQLVAAANVLEKDEDLAIMFIQIGADSSAKAFLDSLDNELQAEGAKFDIVDTKRFEDIESAEAAIDAALTD